MISRIHISSAFILIYIGLAHVSAAIFYTTNLTAGGDIQSHLPLFSWIFIVCITNLDEE